ncbi:ribosome silencing factor [Bifidobacteriaceae bacterium GH022]|nr:ribosome silencing factor [Bifidobacteriaceae bacterium GH022]
MAALESSVNAIRIAAAAADRLKATNCQAFDVSNLLGITDAMLVVSASNERQVLAVSEEIEKDLYLKDNKRKPISREGLELAQWILLDFGDFVVHIMHEEAREFYRLERLWNDCPAIDLQLPEHSESDANDDDGDNGDNSDNGDYAYDEQNGD